MRDVDLAWFAGIFEGEGCFSIEKNGNVKLTVGMTDPDIIDRIKALFPKHQNVKPIQPQPARVNGNPCKMRYTWRVSDPDEARRITEMILPWLGERRSAKAQEVLEHLRTRPGMGGYQRAKTHCPKGHEYTPENTIYKGGENKYRTCRTCAKVWWTAQNAKKEPGAPRIETSSCRVCGKTFSFQVKTRHPTSCSDECRKEARRQDQRNFHQRRKSQSQGQVISA